MKRQGERKQQTAESRPAYFLQTLKRPPWRTVVPACVLLFSLWFAHAVWRPGLDVTDGRDDLGKNGLWLQHGWIGADSWFTENNKTDRRAFFRSPKTVQTLAHDLRARHITDVFPHLCPTLPNGEILPVDDAQTERFLSALHGVRVLPWVGGVLNSDVAPTDPKRCKVFVQSIVRLLQKHPKLVGVHLNVEPWPSGNQPMLHLLDDLRRALPKGKILSVAAYPPPTRWHPYSDVHWDAAYYKEVARRVDQIVVMLYDTSLKDPKMYEWLVGSWTTQVLDGASQSQTQTPSVLLGLPAYDDEGVGYHDPKAENLATGLRGVHAGLSRYPSLPPAYQGVAVYSDWEMDDAEWQTWRNHFAKP